jgi:hypothetical protein
MYYYYSPILPRVLATFEFWSWWFSLSVTLPVCIGMTEQPIQLEQPGIARQNLFN